MYKIGCLQNVMVCEKLKKYIYSVSKDTHKNARDFGLNLSNNVQIDIAIITSEKI